MGDSYLFGLEGGADVVFPTPGSGTQLGF